MNKIRLKIQRRILRAKRTRSRIRGTKAVPRLSVHISLKHVSAQLIDDEKGRTLAYATSVGNRKATGSLTNKAIIVGELIAQKAQKQNIQRVVFDRGYKKYHGRIKALADAARSKGLEF